MNATSNTLAVHDDDTLLNTAQAAEALNKSESWMVQQRKAGREPVWVRIGERGVAYLHGDIRAYKRNRRQLART